MRRKKGQNLHQAFTEKRKALCWFVFIDVFRTQLNIHDGAFFAKTVFPNFETFKVEKKKDLPVSRIWTDWQIGDWDALCGFILFLVAVAAFYCINPSNVAFELFVDTWFYSELVRIDHVRQKNGLLL